MKKLSQRQKTARACMIATIVFALAYTAVFLLIFYRQYYWENRALGFYMSDTHAHVRFGQSGQSLYSLMYLTLGLLDRLPMGGVWIAAFLTALLLFGIWATKMLLQYLLPKQNKWVVWMYAFVCNMVFPITMAYVPHFGDFRYKGMLNFNIYHNSTYIGMKPFALLTMLFLFKILKTYAEQRMSFKDWAGLAGMMLVATAFKPNFIVGFAVAILVVLIVDFIRVRGKHFLNFVIMGSTVLPGFFLTLYQSSALYESDSSSSQLKIGFLTALRAVVNHPEIPLLLSFVFPLVIFAFCFKDLKSDKYYRFAWLHMLINLAMTVLLYETGARFRHGNYFWGSYFAVGVVFILSVAKLDELIENKRMGALTVSSMALGAHVLCWVNYVCTIIKGAKPF